MCMVTCMCLRLCLRALMTCMYLCTCTLMTCMCLCAFTPVTARAACVCVQFDQILASYKKHSRQWSATFNRFADGRRGEWLGWGWVPPC